MQYNTFDQSVDALMMVLTPKIGWFALHGLLSGLADMGPGGRGRTRCVASGTVSCPVRIGRAQ
jgi:hypothetical protein